jgi:hypothetical protein
MIRESLSRGISISRGSRRPFTPALAPRLLGPFARLFLFASPPPPPPPNPGRARRSAAAGTPHPTPRTNRANRANRAPTLTHTFKVLAHSYAPPSPLPLPRPRSPARTLRSAGPLNFKGTAPEVPGPRLRIAIRVSLDSRTSARPRLPTPTSTRPRLGSYSPPPTPSLSHCRTVALSLPRGSFCGTTLLTPRPLVYRPRNCPSTSAA